MKGLLHQLTPQYNLLKGIVVYRYSKATGWSFDSYRCPTCNYRFKFRATLEKHMNNDIVTCKVGKFREH